jgi:SAM-dependent methyltransferase
MKFNTMPLAFKYCVGQGIELGAAAHNPFDLPDCLFVATCDGVNYLYPEDMNDYACYRDAQVDLSGDLVKIDLIGDFQDLDADDEQFDYIISSHVIEHVPNLIGAYVESARVMKNGGVFFCIFPKRTAEPTDAPRPLTTLEEMIASYENEIDMSKMPKESWRGHYQVFSLQNMIRAVNYINTAGIGNWLIECVEETDSKVSNGHTIVVRKMDRLQEVKWPSPDAYNDVINNLVENEDFGTALSILKTALSFDFFDATKLYVAAMLSIKVNDVNEGVEFLQQALILDPENAQYRKEFINVTGKMYINPVL